MQTFPSRSEKRLTNLYSAAESGCMSLERELLYGSEIRRYRKQGFVVSHDESPSRPNLYNSEIDWSHAFGDSVPYSVCSYITGRISTYPKSSVKSFAQELYVIAARAIYSQK